MLKSQNVSVRARLNSWEERWVPWENDPPAQYQPLPVRPRAQKGNGEKGRGILDVALSSFLLVDLGEKWGKKERRWRLRDYGSLAKGCQKGCLEVHST